MVNVSGTFEVVHVIKGFVIGTEVHVSWMYLATFVLLVVFENPKVVTSSVLRQESSDVDFGQGLQPVLYITHHWTS